MASALVLDRTRKVSPVVRGALEDAGLQVVWRYTAREAMETIRAEPPAIIVVTTNQAKRRDALLVMRFRELTDVPIVMVYEQPAEGGGASVLEAGADDYVPESDGRRRLAARIQAKLRRSPGNG